MMSHFDIPTSHRKHAEPMRSVMTDAELKLGNALRAHRLMGLGFRRQLPIAGFVVDFACGKHKLIVEVDGLQHGDDETATYDAQRTAALEALGWSVVRVWNNDVLTNIAGVRDAIVRTIEAENLK